MSIDEALALLGLHSAANSTAIKAAYRELVKVWHPDQYAHDPVFRLEAEAKLAEINRAYQVLREGVGERTSLYGGDWANPIPDVSYAEVAKKSFFSRMRTRRSMTVVACLGGIAAVAAVVSIRYSFDDDLTVRPPAANVASASLSDEPKVNAGTDASAGDPAKSPTSDPNDGSIDSNTASATPGATSAAPPAAIPPPPAQPTSATPKPVPVVAAVKAP